MLQAARERLVTLAEDSKLIDAANLLNVGAELVVVCDSDGVLQGVVTKTDIVKQISNCQGATCMWPVSGFLTRDVVLCWGSDHVEDVSDLMKQRHLKNIPVVDANNRPIGVLTARAILRALLSDAEYEEAQLVDYVKGLGYR
jgi:CBS domain-containing protein